MNYEPTHLDLFSGIGGFALAAQWAGFRTVAFCEIDKYCQKILAQNFATDAVFSGHGELLQQKLRPERYAQTDTGGNGKARIVPNIFDFDGTAYRGVSLLTGGFPCQPFSVAGKRRGAADDRAIWPEMFRVIKEARPSWVLGENVPGIIPMELDNVLSDLESIGYATRPFVIPACAVDARHRRDRLWVIAHASDDGSNRNDSSSSNEGAIPQDSEQQRSGGPGRVEGLRGYISNTTKRRLSQSEPKPRQQERQGSTTTERTLTSDHCRWLPEPVVGRVAHGIPSRVDRIKGLGNAIVPQVAYEILRAIYREVIDSMHDSA